MRKTFPMIVAFWALGLTVMMLARPIVASARVVTWTELKCMYHPTQCRVDPPPQAPTGDPDDDKGKG